MPQPTHGTARKGHRTFTATTLPTQNPTHHGCNKIRAVERIAALATGCACLCVCVRACVHASVCVILPTDYLPKILLFENVKYNNLYIASSQKNLIYFNIFYRYSNDEVSQRNGCSRIIPST